MKILFIDPNASILNAYGMMADNLGIDYLLSQDSSKAIKQTYNIDLIICELFLGTYGLIEFLQELRSFSDGLIPVVIVTKHQVAQEAIAAILASFEQVRVVYKNDFNQVMLHELTMQIK
jgi:DNA-binding NtrC family response regulator